ncbi:MAG: dihydroxy-acid dehydratase, partial [Verrucomicrobiales bacterium]
MADDEASGDSLNWNSRQVTRGWQSAMQSFFWGLGFTEEDFDRPQVGIGVPLLEGNLCNVHAYELASHIKEGCTAAGLIGFPFGTPGISDNLTQGLEGGNASLPSRNLIANCAEMATSAHCYDAMVGLHHCDKNGPGFAMALARMNYPGLLVSGGTILPGCHKGEEITSATPYDAQSAVSMGKMDPEEAAAIVRSACPGPGGCGIAASFNTWGVAMEAIGLMLPDSSSRPAVDKTKRTECEAVGAAVRVLLEKDI